MKLVSISLFVLSMGVHSNALAQDDTYQKDTSAPSSSKEGNVFEDFSTSPDQHGLGFGLMGMGSSGLTIFYDYNIHDMNLQIHTQFDSAGEERKNLDGDTGAKLAQNDLAVSARYVFSKGWYLGAGLGRYNTTIEVHQAADVTGPEQTLNFYQRGLLGVVEGGWQGNEFYYFHVGIRPSILLTRDKKYDLNQVRNVANHRDTTDELWEKGARYTALVVGFGWYLQP